MEMNDILSRMESAVRFTPTCSIRFLADELRRYGIKTKKQDDRGKTVFYQSAHIVMQYQPTTDTVSTPELALVSFKDLFKFIGKNEEGVDDNDIVRVFVIADKLERRNCLKITGLAKQIVTENEELDLPDIYVNLNHIHNKDKDKENISYRSKFSTNKMYVGENGDRLIGASDYFVLINGV